MSDHSHIEGVFCDDCPDALRRNIKRILVQHQWVTLPDSPHNCTCGWVMPFTEKQQHAGHQADVLAATLSDLGWTRVAALPSEPVPTVDAEVEFPGRFDHMMDDRTIEQLREQTYSDAFTIYGLREALGDFEDEAAIREDERQRWTDWLASTNYGIDYSSEIDPPCTLDDLAEAMYRVDPSELVETWAWCVTENTGAFTSDDPTTEADR